MTSLNIFPWPRRSFPKGSNRRQPSTVKLALEVLESRLAPATFTVMDNSDNVADPASLRFALANVAAGSTIDFAPSVRNIVLTSNTTLTIGTNVSIVNDQGTGPVTIDGNNAVTVFTISNPTTASLSGLTITHGIGTVNYPSGIPSGGAITNSFGTLTISDCTFIGNNAIDNSPGHNSHGGAIESSGTITIDNCTFSTNTADQSGGAIDNHGELTVSGSTFVGNSTSLGSGSAIDNANSLTVNNCTFAGNSSGAGGAVSNLINATITDSTFSGNTVAADITGFGSAGGVFNNFRATLTLNGDILVGNTGPSGFSDIVDEGAISPMSANNVVGVVNAQTLANGVNGNQVGVTPAQVALAPLADNGGPTLTMALLPGSVAIGMGQTGVDPTDQRGEPRPTTTRADAGAFQTQGNQTQGNQSNSLPPAVSVAFGPFGEVVEVVNSVGALTQFDATGVHQLSTAGVRDASIAFAAGGQVLLLTYTDGSLYQFDAAGAHLINGGGVLAASVAFGPGGEVLEIVDSTGLLTQYDAAGAHLISGSVQSASVAFGPAGEVLEINDTAGLLTQYDATGTHVISGEVQSAGVAFARNSLVLDIIFSDGTLDQFDAFGVHNLGMVP